MQHKCKSWLDRYRYRSWDYLASWIRLGCMAPRFLRDMLVLSIWPVRACTPGQALPSRSRLATCSRIEQIARPDALARRWPGPDSLYAALGGGRAKAWTSARSRPSPQAEFSPARSPAFGESGACVRKPGQSGNALAWCCVVEPWSCASVLARARTFERHTKDAQRIAQKQAMGSAKATGSVPPTMEFVRSGIGASAGVGVGRGDATGSQQARRQKAWRRSRRVREGLGVSRCFRALASIMQANGYGSSRRLGSDPVAFQAAPPPRG